MITTKPGFFRTRDGRKAQVVGKVDIETSHPWLGMIHLLPCQWSNAGYYCSCNVDDPLDLIRPWEETLTAPDTPLYRGELITVIKKWRESIVGKPSDGDHATERANSVLAYELSHLIHYLEYA